MSIFFIDQPIKVLVLGSSSYQLNMAEAAGILRGFQKRCDSSFYSYDNGSFSLFRYKELALVSELVIAVTTRRKALSKRV